MIVGYATAVLLARQERVAKSLHKFYRAAAKALSSGKPGGPRNDEHDHGWEACQSKRYFRSRAMRHMQEMNECGGPDV